MRHLLEKFVKGNSGFVISFLGYFVESLQIFDLKNVFIDQKFKEIFRLFYQLHMAILDINFIEYFLLDNPVFLN